jgi:hypothetical protein
MCSSSPKYDTSAICTPTVAVPSLFFLIEIASSKSSALGGSIVKIRSSRRSLRISNSRSGILRSELHIVVLLDLCNLRPGQGWKTFDSLFRELFSWDVTILK